MIDFRELHSDGVAFEQLFREIAMLKSLHPEWTGKGPDGGRDLILTEEAVGEIAGFKRRWVVSCKHNATSGKAVSGSDMPSIIDTCARTEAQGFLLACSTQPSSEVVRMMDEISSNRLNRVIASYWDGVTIEKFLLSPSGFHLAHQFFPKSMKDVLWNIHGIIGHEGLHISRYMQYKCT